MVSEIPDKPIYDYNVHLEQIGKRMPELPKPAVPSSKPELDPLVRDPCAIGHCPQCGRTVISAVHSTRHPLRMLCGRCYEWPRS